MTVFSAIMLENRGALLECARGSFFHFAAQEFDGQALSRLAFRTADVIDKLGQEVGCRRILDFNRPPKVEAADNQFASAHSHFKKISSIGKTLRPINAANQR